MDQTIFNNSEYSDKYLQQLNLCFPGWGGNVEFEWVFKRTFESRDPDFFYIQNEHGEVFAGSGISYRVISSPNGSKNVIGIMTGSWTLPAARGRGYFSKIIEVSRKRCAENGVPLLTAFVMETNSSYKGLKNAGSHIIKSFTCLSSKVIKSDVRGSLIKSLDLNDFSIKSLYVNLINSRIIGFNYSYQDFIKQFIKRPKSTSLLAIGKNTFLVEESDSVLKILLHTFNESTFLKDVNLLASWSLKFLNKQLMSYTTSQYEMLFFKRLGYNILPGYFTILPCMTGFEELNIYNDIVIYLGDKM